MQGLAWRLVIGIMIAACQTKGALAQKTLSWQEVRDRFEAAMTLIGSYLTAASQLSPAGGREVIQ